MSIPLGVSAGGVSPYLPLNTSPELERQIERVLILAGKPVMTRPIAVETVLEALPDARKRDEELCEQVETYLMRYMQDYGMPHLRTEVSVSTGDSDQVIPNQHGKNVDSSWEVSGGGYYRPGEYVLINLGGIAYDGSATPTGSMLSLGIDYAQFDIGYRDHWLSPFTDSSMLISAEAPTMPSVTLSNYKPISRLGLSYQVFLAEMSESNRIVYMDRFTTGNPKLAGLHLQAEPASGYAIGINRQLQYSGGERDQDGIGDFMNALFNPSKYDNTADNYDQEFGNQQASLTGRMLFPGKRPFAVYFEYAGEDTSRYQNYLLGNVSFSLGVDFPLIWDRFDLAYETTEWQNAWYVHHIYQDGLTNHDEVIGHWFGDQRRFNDDTGGNSHMLRLGWQAEDGSYLQTAYRTLKNSSYSAFEYHRMHELTLSYFRPWKRQQIGVEVSSGRDVYGDWYTRLATSLDIKGGWTKAIRDDIASDLVDDSTELFLDIGATSTYLKTDRGIETDKRGWTSDGVNAHLGLGVRRAVSEHNDLGVRIEWDRAAGHDLLSVRLTDYRYRINKRFSLNGFFGVGSYQYNTPAYGWYMGLGSQLLNVRPRWDLCVDSRLHLKNVRDKALESDPSGIRQPDFYNFLNVTLYLSRHW